MKKQLAALSIISSLILFGCSAKESAVNKIPAKDVNSVTATTSGQASQTSSAETSAIEKQRVEVNTNFKAVQPNSVPKLSAQQKSQIDSKLSSTLNSIDKTLKSLQDAPDINLNSIGN